MTHTTQSNCATYTYNPILTKKDIIHKLFLEQKITFDEMWILLQEDGSTTKYVPMPYPYPAPVYPQYPWQQPIIYSVSNTNNNPVL